MSYGIYKTSGFIIGSKHTGEANKIFTIFTKDLGLIKASAQNVRSVQSKLRFHLQEFHFTDFCFVKGKEFWRITSVSGAEDFYAFFKNKENYFHFYIKILNFLHRLLHGEEANEKLFETIFGAFYFLKSNRFDDNQLSNLECILVLRILHILGYVGDTEKFQKFLIHDEWGENLLLAMNEHQKSAIKAINESLKESHL